MTVLKTILEARKTMTHNESCEYAGTMRKGECPGCSGVGVDLSMGAKDSMSEAVDKIDTADFKLNKAGKKTKAHKIVFRTGEDETQIKDEPTKVHEETKMDTQLEEMTDAQMAERERLVKGMKKSYKGFVDKYGKERAKSVMYATATKKAMEEEVNDIDEAAKVASFTGSHQGSTTIKHIKNPTVQQRMAAHDIKPGVAGYRDRIDLLKDAERAGKMKKEEIIEILSEESADDIKAKASAQAELNKELEKMIDLDSSEYFILITLAIPILFFGFYPDPLINTIEVSVKNLIETFK